MNDFEKEVAALIAVNSKDEALQQHARTFMRSSICARYSYGFSWLGRPIIQYPQDIMAMQEIVWQVKPDLIIETGIAHGGSVVFSASMLALLDICDLEDGVSVSSLRRKVLGIDIDIRKHNYGAIKAHPMSSRIEMIQGSSVDQKIIEQVQSIAGEYERILVCLDSNHTHEHVLAELEAYASLVSCDSYCCVFDTIIEDMPADMFSDRPWEPGNNPKTAVWEYLRTHPEFEVDESIQHKLLLTVAPEGFLKRIR